MPLHAARRRTINAVDRPYLPKGRKDARTFAGAADLARTENDKGRRDPSAECKESAFFAFLRSIKRRSQKKICCACG